ncbi:MAG: hypothetical protein KIH01_04575 [Candidatus Freyarchaeota archaeon]|nr:hypothetical protein [Candidatus Jordarchaeia archaeon]
MTFVCFLWHIHQPPGDKRHLIEAASKSYQPLLGFYLESGLEASFNVTGVTVDQAVKLSLDFISHLRDGVSSGAVDLTASGFHHLILPLTPTWEVEEDIKLGLKIFKEVLDYTPEGFFPPELAWSPFLADVLRKLGFRWVVVSDRVFRMADPRCPEDEVFFPYWLEGVKGKHIVGVLQHYGISQMLWEMYSGKKTIGDFVSALEQYVLMEERLKERYHPYAATKSLIVVSTDAELIGLRWKRGFEALSRIYELAGDIPGLKLCSVKTALKNNMPKKAFYMPSGSWSHDARFTVWLGRPENDVINALIGEARRRFELSHCLILTLKSMNFKTDDAEQALREALESLMLGEMSDGRGWDAAPERRRFCYHHLLKSIEKSGEALTKALEKCSRRMKI